jgi:hypothetical protein
LLFQRPLHPGQTANPNNEIRNPKQTSYLEIRYSKLILIGCLRGAVSGVQKKKKKKKKKKDRELPGKIYPQISQIDAD